MATDHTDAEIAKSMMDSALILLDSLGEAYAAVHLQQAICLLRGDMAAASIEEADEFLAGSDAIAIMDRWTDRGPEPL